MPRHCLWLVALALAGAAVVTLAPAGCGLRTDRQAEEVSDAVLERMSGDAPAAATAPLAPPAAPKTEAKAEAPKAEAPKAETPAAKQVAATPPPAPPPAPKPAPKTGEVRLSLLEAIRYALANNHEIQIAAYQPAFYQQDVTKAWGVFDPTVFATNQETRNDRPIQSTLDTGSITIADLIERRSQTQYGIRQKMLSGGTVSLYQEQDYLKSNSVITLPNPQYTGNLNAELKQPLLKGGGEMVNKAPIVVANLNANVGFQDFRQKVMEALNNTVGAYWQLAFDLENVAVAQRTVDLAEEVLRREEVRRKNGMSNDLSVNRAQSAVSSRRAEVIRAQNRARNSMDKLKLLMNTSEVPLDSEVRVIPTEKPTFYVFEVDRSEAVAKALINRPEVESARTAVAINQVRVDVSGHEKLPKLDATLRYTMNGLGTRMGESYEGEYTARTTGWLAGLELEMPIGNRDAKADWRKALIQYQQSLLDADRLAATAVQEVNLAVRMILQARDEVEATLKAKLAAEMTVKGEFARFELGETSNYELLQSQDTLGAAERDYLQALLSFNLALTELSHAQGTMLEDRGIDVIRPEGPRSETLPMKLQLKKPAPQTVRPTSVATRPGESETQP